MSARGERGRRHTRWMGRRSEGGREGGREGGVGCSIKVHDEGEIRI